MRWPKHIRVRFTRGTQQPFFQGYYQDRGRHFAAYDEMTIFMRENEEEQYESGAKMLDKDAMSDWNNKLIRRKFIANG